ncbi:MAG: signal recognition particle protein [Alphaproteobacteria bacterium]|nr:signal recognition particle protein [Alphaproteobacteria bacterium]
MFETLGNRLNGIFDRLTGRGHLSEDDVNEALRDVRIALLEADVALPVAKDFIDGIRAKAVGEAVLRSVTPGQQVVKIVHDGIVDLLGRESVPLDLNVNPPAVILMLGLQGSGKTTTSAKLARRLKEEDKKKVLLASLDTQRPAAQEQLAVLAGQIGAGILPVVAGENPEKITKRALEVARLEGYDVLVLDTAGRLSIDAALMAEAAAVSKLAQPSEKLLVVDAMTGQDAVNTARNFHEQIGVTGIVLTRIDGDTRGGAALSMRAVTQQPIKFFGTGEKTGALEVFHPDRLAGRILGMGDVVTLVEKAAASIDQESAAKTVERMQKGQFDFEDLADQFRQMQRMGGIGGLMGMLPGVGKLKEQIAGANIDDKMVKRQEAIILSMTRAERRDVGLLNGSRRRRIANGAGVDVADVNRLVKQYLSMRDMMRKVGKMNKKGLLGNLGKNLPGMLSQSTHKSN